MYWSPDQAPQNLLVELRRYNNIEVVMYYATIITASFFSQKECYF